MYQSRSFLFVRTNEAKESWWILPESVYDSRPSSPSKRVEINDLQRSKNGTNTTAQSRLQPAGALPGLHVLGPPEQHALSTASASPLNKDMGHFLEWVWVWENSCASELLGAAAAARSKKRVAPLRWCILQGRGPRRVPPAVFSDTTVVPTMSNNSGVARSAAARCRVEKITHTEAAATEGSPFANGVFLHTHTFHHTKTLDEKYPHSKGDFSRMHFSRQPCRCPEKVTKMAEKESATEKCERARGCMLKFHAHAGRNGNERSVTVHSCQAARTQKPSAIRPENQCPSTTTIRIHVLVATTRK